jgi:YgiT-type zinc finger domain-containing protein
MVKCKCGTELAEKLVRKHHIQLSNHGVVEFDAPSLSCHNCGESIFVEEDVDVVFDAFDASYKQKHMH